ncbi:hypothetical protein [Rhizobium sp. AAP43]|uniref:hypothetical protein n=1 Tax=Rhizobium sp. AAP43 TaxID=1523420 RepID=UPI0006B88587|nr:hypothetical protein [Rhizobium sp. AAP43]KPF47061.1 hypothetical protein IP76_01805 [Rhizobium sp. AAP43]
MAVLTKRASSIFAPVNADGSPRGADLGEASVWGTEVERALAAVGADALEPGDIPPFYVDAYDAGAGAANAIEATTSGPVAEGVPVFMNIFETSGAGPVTVRFNGAGPAYTIKTASGNDPATGGLPAGMQVIGRISGTQFRLYTDQVSSAIVAAAEAAAQRAEDALADLVAGAVLDGSVTNAKVASNAAIDATKLAFTQAVAGAVPRSIQLKLADAISAKDFGARGDAVVQRATVSIASGAAVLTVGAALFSAGDVGKSIAVEGAGAAGGILNSTILSFTSSTQVTLSTNASTTLSVSTNKTVAFGTDNYAAIVAALDVAGSTRTVNVPDGLYYVSQAIVRTTPFKLAGFSDAAVLLLPRAGALLNIDATSASNSGGAISNIRFASITNASGAYGIRVTGAASNFVALWNFTNVRLSGFNQSVSISKGHSLSGSWYVSFFSANTFDNLIVDEYNGNRAQYGIAGDGANTLTVSGGLIRADISGISLGNGSIGFGDILVVGVHFNFCDVCVTLTGSTTSNFYKHNIAIVNCQFDGEVLGIRSLTNVDTYTEVGCNYGGAGVSPPSSVFSGCVRVSIIQTSLKSELGNRKTFTGGAMTLDVVQVLAMGATYKSARVEVVAMGTVTGVGECISHQTFMVIRDNVGAMSVTAGTQTQAPGSGDRFSIGMTTGTGLANVRITLPAAHDGTEVSVQVTLISDDFVMYAL